MAAAVPPVDPPITSTEVFIVFCCADASINKSEPTKLRQVNRHLYFISGKYNILIKK
jgi:hypothetical protein